MRTVSTNISIQSEPGHGGLAMAGRIKSFIEQNVSAAEVQILPQRTRAGALSGNISCLALACLIGSAMPAYCQAPQPNDRVKIEVSRAALQMIGQGLMELPYKTAAPVLSDLQAQLNAQDQAAAKAKAEDKPADKPAE